MALLLWSKGDMNVGEEFMDPAKHKARYLFHEYFVLKPEPPKMEPPEGARDYQLFDLTTLKS